MTEIEGTIASKRDFGSFTLVTLQEHPNKTIRIDKRTGAVTVAEVVVGLIASLEEEAGIVRITLEGRSVPLLLPKSAHGDAPALAVGQRIQATVTYDVKRLEAREK